jgi:hypothetical protein
VSAIVPLEAWLFAGACGGICALLVGFGMDLVQRGARAEANDGAEQGDARP